MNLHGATYLSGSYWLSAIYFILSLWSFGIASAADDNIMGPWKSGRATYFGADGWSIHRGSCGLGYQFRDIYPGFDVIAVSDLSPEYSNSCGKCFEVGCTNESFTDGYGQYQERSGACYDESKTLVVRVVDTCPCEYPSNAYSNKRWCCQDQGAGEMHGDLSVWAYERLGKKDFGSMKLKYREVPCNYYPANPAPQIDNHTPFDIPPSGAAKPHEKIFVKRTDDKGVRQGAVYSVDDESQAQYQTTVPAEQLYKDGTIKLSYGAPLEYSSPNK
ncbi:hypothetical protein M9434_003559 [Picochlorum sp. BPE23]|nr:hypothetical protein M9434_003559 [Picochlorum sp. BPE23]